MVRIIERSTIDNKDLFDKLWERTKDTKLWSSDQLLMTFCQMLGMTNVHPLLMVSMQQYCARYPYTTLVNDSK